MAVGCVLITGTYGDYDRAGGSGGTTANGGAVGVGGANFPCSSAALCPPASECMEATCADGVCGMAHLPSGTPTVTQVKGDCLTQVCSDGAKTSQVPDDSDVPNDGNDCTLEACKAGLPETKNATGGTPCGSGTNLTCDGNGNCQGCTSPADCGKCQTCDAGVCKSAPAGTASGDCAATPPCGGTGSCDGNGGCTLAAAGTDCGTDCTNNVATPRTCDGSGSCVNGTGTICGGFACTPGGCKTSCASSVDCAPSFSCNTAFHTCLDCRTCGDWLNGAPSGLNCQGNGCALYDAIRTSCCDNVCGSQCSGNALELCTVTTSSCFGLKVTATCLACLQADTTCKGLVGQCVADTGH
jgi:hypothetical protein